MKNYQTEVFRYQPKPKAEVDNDKVKLDNSSYHVEIEFNNCFVIYLVFYYLFIIHIPTPPEVDVVIIGMTS